MASFLIPNHLAGSTGSLYRDESIISSGSRFVSFVRGCGEKRRKQFQKHNHENAVTSVSILGYFSDFTHNSWKNSLKKYHSSSKSKAILHSAHYLHSGLILQIEQPINGSGCCRNNLVKFTTMPLAGRVGVVCVCVLPGYSYWSTPRGWQHWVDTASYTQ